MKISIFLLLINVAFAQTLIKPATNSVNSFNFKLNSTLDLLSDDFVYSSYSITTALSMLYIGSVGDSKNEIMKTFEFSENVDSCASYFNTFSNTLNTNSFKSINALWSDSTRVEFLTPYIRTIDNQYLSLIHI